MQGTALEAYQAEISSRLVSFAEVKAMPPKFLWEPYLRLNNLNIVRGDGGAGKTMLVLAILAAITRGKAPDGMPGILRCQASDVLYLGAEDDLEDYRHRLDLCGCARGEYLHPVRCRTSVLWRRWSGLSGKQTRRPSCSTPYKRFCRRART